MNQSKTRDYVLCALFAALIAIGAFIKIPVPVVPFTLQFLFTTLAGLLLGPRLGAMSVLLYIVVGLIGIPVFAEGGGLGYVFKPSFGYLLGFALGAAIAGYIAERAASLTVGRLAWGNFLNLLVVYLTGMVYFYCISNFYLDKPIAIWPLILYCFILAVPGDSVLCYVAAVLGKRLIPILKRR